MNSPVSGSTIADKMAGLDDAWSWKLQRTEDGYFFVIIKTKSKLLSGPMHVVSTGKHKNVNKALDEALEVFIEHLNDCPVC